MQCPVHSSMLNSIQLIKRIQFYLITNMKCDIVTESQLEQTEVPKTFIYNKNIHHQIYKMLFHSTGEILTAICATFEQINVVNVSQIPNHINGNKVFSRVSFSELNCLVMMVSLFFRTISSEQTSGRNRVFERLMIKPTDFKNETSSKNKNLPLDNLSLSVIRISKTVDKLQCTRELFAIKCVFRIFTLCLIGLVFYTINVVSLFCMRFNLQNFN